MPYIKTNPEAYRRIGNFVESSQNWLFGRPLIILASIILVVNCTQAHAQETSYDMSYLEREVGPRSVPRVSNKCWWVDPESIPDITIYVDNATSSLDPTEPILLGLRFTDHNGHEQSIWHEFFYDGLDGPNQIWVSDDQEYLGNGLDFLKELQDVESGRRSHWDNIELIRNDLLGSGIWVKAINLTLNYVCEGGQFNITILDKNVSILEILDPVTIFTPGIHLTPYIEEYLLDEYDLSTYSPEVTKLMAKDIGKFGSDSDYPSSDAKYDEDQEENQCSETISWYYYNYIQRYGYGKGLQINSSTPGVFKNIYKVTELLDVFENAGQLYHYVHSLGKWCKSTDWADDQYNSSNCTYEPKQADYLAFIIPASKSEKDMHSMMVFKDWDGSDKIERIDGPWPVRRKSSGELYDPDNLTKRWYVGRVRETLSINNKFWEWDNLFRAHRINFEEINLQPEGTLTAMGTVIKLRDGFHARQGSEITVTHEKGIIGYHIEEEYECVENDCELGGIPCCGDEHCVGGHCEAP